MTSGYCISATGIDFHEYDVNEGNTTQDNFVMLGGYKLPYKYNVLAHSDGDVLLHALVDAILGIICKGDIGQHFSDKDPKWKNASSSIFVAETMKMLSQKNAKLLHVDCTIICEEPKISKYREEIKNSVAALCNIDSNKVNIKGKTTEKMGFLGRGEGLCAIVTCTAIL